MGPFEGEGWRVRPLTCGLELLEESHRLQHCAERYIGACHQGRYRMFTVECPKSGAPAATIGLVRKEGAWRLDQVRGKVNQNAGEAMERLGAVVLDRYQGRG